MFGIDAYFPAQLETLVIPLAVLFGVLLWGFFQRQPLRMNLAEVAEPPKAWVPGLRGLLSIIQRRSGDCVVIAPGVGVVISLRIRPSYSILRFRVRCAHLVGGGRTMAWPYVDRARCVEIGVTACVVPALEFASGPREGAVSCIGGGRCGHGFDAGVACGPAGQRPGPPPLALAC